MMIEVAGRFLKTENFGMDGFKIMEKLPLKCSLLFEILFIDCASRIQSTVYIDFSFRDGMIWKTINFAL